MPSSTLNRRLRLAAIVVACLLVISLVAGGIWVTWTVRRSFPQVDGKITVPGVSTPVEVVRDSWGVPQLYADNPTDLIRAQGFVHAQDRFWEMDFRRHVTAGRLAELFGPSLVKTDTVIRTLGWRRTAEAELELLAPATRRYLNAYADGVNAYLESRRGSELSLEHGLLRVTNGGYRPERWTAPDSLAWLKAMAWDLRGNMEDEIDRSRLAAHLSVDRIEQLYPAYPYERHRPIVRRGAVVGPKFDQTAAAKPELPSSAREELEKVADLLDGIPPLLGPNGSGIGSNSWVVAGPRTATGKPLLANDPHLGPSLPSVWYQVGLHCRKVSPDCPFDVAGVSFAGVPGVIIGHTNKVAWGFTNLGPDVTDLYLEKVSGNTYQYERKQLPLEVRQEEIKVAGGDPVRITVRSTRHGPLLSDADEEFRDVGRHAPASEDNPVPTSEPTGKPTGKATGAPTQGAAKSPIQSPSQPAGQSPSQPAGQSPSQPAGQSPSQPAGQSPTQPSTQTPPPTPGAGRAEGGDEGKRQEYAVALRWTASDAGRTADAIFLLNTAQNWAQFQAAAKLFDVPAQNLLYADTAGNIGYQAPGRVPIRRGGDGRWPVPGWTKANDWAGYIPFDAMPNAFNPPNGYIVTANNAVIGPAYPYLLTTDWDYGYRSQRINELIEDVPKLDVAAMQRIQKDSRNPMAALLVPKLLEFTVDPFTEDGQRLLRGWDYTQPADSAAAAYFNGVWRKLLERTFHDEMPQGLRPDGGSRWFEVVRILFADPDNLWWDDTRTDKRETRDEILQLALHDARRELTTRLGKRADAWKWGTLHRLELNHASFGTAEVPGVIRKLFNRGPFETAGGDSLVDATGWNAENGYKVNWVPSMRMVVDLGNLDSSRWVNLTGASGHPYHDNYLDQAKTWRDGWTIPFPFSREAVTAGGKHTLTLEPEAR